MAEPGSELAAECRRLTLRRFDLAAREGRATGSLHETIGLVTTPEPISDEINVLRAALAAERAARQQAEARASGVEAMVMHLKLLIARMKRERVGC